ncbi:MAG: protein kinase domain-containing protein, partial [Nannocystaceae bacterium]
MYSPGGQPTELTQDVFGDAPQTQAEILPLGQRLGPYRLVRYVGSGAMGLVYKAIDEDFKEPVAIKTLARMEPRRLFSLKHEFRALAGVRHPNLVRHDELAKEGDDWYFAMEYVDGEDIMQVL